MLFHTAFDKLARGKLLDRWHVWRIGLIVSSTAVYAGCSLTQPEVAPEASVNYSHPNGLSLHLQKSLTVERTPDGFHIYPKAANNRRVPIEVNVTLYSGEVKPQGKWSQPGVLNRNISYQITKYEGGSGGDQYRLEVWKKHPGGYTVFVQNTQDELGAPDFELCWQAIEASSVGQ